jgi:hypothetical protein
MARLKRGATFKNVSATRILSKAAELVQLGVPAFEAIEIACKRISTTPAARDRARTTFLSLFAKAEREVA